MLGSTMGPLMGSAMSFGFTPASRRADSAAAARPRARRGGGGGRSGCAGVRVRWGLGRFGGPGSSGLGRRVVGAAELGLGRDTSGGDAGWRAVGVGVAGRQSGRGRWATNGSWATNDGRDAAGRRDGRRSGRRRCSCFQIRAAPHACWRARQPPDTHRTRHRAPAAAYPVPAGFSTNGHAPPGYTPAIVYLPTNGHAPHTTNDEGRGIRLVWVTATGVFR